MYIMLAERYGWSQLEVEACDAEYIEEVTAFIAARTDLEKENGGREQQAQTRQSAHSRIASKHMR